jgi:hypothetical protein
MRSPEDRRGRDPIVKPVPADDEVLVAVRAAAVNTFDWYMVRGKPALFRVLLASGQKPYAHFRIWEVWAESASDRTLLPSRAVVATCARLGVVGRAPLPRALGSQDW